VKLTKKRVRTPDQRIRMIERVVAQSALEAQGVRLRQIVIQDMLSTAKDRDDLGQIRAVFDWVKGNIRYIEDPVSLDLYPSALVTLSLGGGDCDDHVILIDSALAVIGFQVGARVICTDSGEWHIYALVWTPKNAPDLVIPLDTTWPGAERIGQEYPKESVSYSKSWVFNFKR